MTQAKRWKELSPEEAIRALYIDFEGQKDKPPVLLGVTRWSKPKDLHRALQFVTDERFEALAKVDGLRAMTLPDAIDYVIKRADAKGRRIVAWSEHELKIVRTYSPGHTQAFEDRFCNARALAERWQNKVRASDKPTGDLSAYMDRVGYQVPVHAGPGKAGDTIGILTLALSKPRSLDLLTENQWGKWLALRDHNRHDCAGMRQVCLVAAQRLASTSHGPDQQVG